MIDYLLSVNTVYLALIAGIFSLIFTVWGASIVFLFHKVDNFVMDIMLSISAGIMLAAAFFSLLNPAIELVHTLKLNIWVHIIGGFTFGCLLIFGSNYLISYLTKTYKNTLQCIRRDIMLLSSITLHNIPEGLVIGVSYGAILYSSNYKIALLSAVSLTIGIALQNFPEGAAISLPLRRDGFSLKKSFIFASLSGIVEPISAVLGALLVLKIKLLLPFILAFTAGAMLFVVIMEMIPESQKNSNKAVMTLFELYGFLMMMVMELLLG